MPLTVIQLFNEVGLFDIKSVQWNEPPITNESGVYVVSTSSDPAKNIAKSPIFDDSQISNWVKNVTTLALEGKPATTGSVKARLHDLWIPNENILYIGKASKRKDGRGIKQRVSEFYRHGIGSKKPHRGGFWIKTLKHIDELMVYYHTCENVDNIEFQMQAFFMKNVNSSMIKNKIIKDFPLPFANIRHQIDKNHGFTRQTI